MNPQTRASYRLEGCGKGSYFVRVAYFRDWIDEQLRGATFCQNNGDADDL